MTPRPVLTSPRSAAAWGLDLARTVRPWDGDLAQVTFREAAHHCATVAARLVLDGNDRAQTWAVAWSLLDHRAKRAVLRLADAADRAERETRA